ncbi:MAG: hypothetical protein ABSG86_32335, partial [Thermoguttaceae bacterium]
METTRREFVRLSGGVMLAELLPAQLANRLSDTLPAKNSNGIFLEAEQFADTGGWDTDQQSLEQMGSSYLLAHGLGVPVQDAVTTVKVSS